MITDFGIAKVVEDLRTGLTTSNAASVTMAYSPPESIEGLTKDTKSDVYSFGCFVLGM